MKSIPGEDTVKVKVAQSCPTLCNPMDRLLYPARLLCPRVIIIEILTKDLEFSISLVDKPVEDF